ncbi:MAG: hypothetical protein H6686_11770, partial [Fibrobacteria bacterium]|nr:hypothetical protein [Fibrobacteria bacterium]
WYDPELGLWISPDPAHEGLSPYAYVGGDPMNFIDPYGLWKVGLGFTIGYDSDNGLNFGVGAAFDFRDEIGIGADASYSYNIDDGSRTLSVGAGANVDLGVVSLEAGASYTNNSKTGTILSAYGGASAFGLGLRGGGSAYWDASGDYMGATAYGMGFLGTTSSYVGSGYEWGFGGQKGRGGFSEVSAMGVKTGYSQNGGWKTSASAKVVSASVDNSGAISVRNYVDEFSDQWRDMKYASASLATFGGIAIGVGMTVLDWKNTKWEVAKDGINIISLSKKFTPKDLEDGALTLGRTRLYSGGATPESIGRYYEKPWLQRLGTHEAFHSKQFEYYGVGGMAWRWFSGGGPSSTNPIENSANLIGMRLY